MNAQNLKYFIYIIKHKYFVYCAGRLLGGIPLWRLIIHDYSKFSKAEWTPYVNRFFSGNSGKEDKSTDSDDFHKAWTHHWHNNPHHWEYWLRVDGVPMEMPKHFAREMVADWLGAGRGITGKWNLTNWYENTKPKQILHPKTRIYIDDMMEIDVKVVIGSLEGKMKGF